MNITVITSCCRLIAVLMAVTVPSLAEDGLTPTQNRCAANMRQIGAAIKAYRGDHTNEYPAWLSCLYPKYLKDKSVLICPADASRGMEGSKPDRLHKEMGENFWRRNKYMETDDCNSRGSTNYYGRNFQVPACSYLYEFNAAKCSWFCCNGTMFPTDDVFAMDKDGNGEISWQEVKFYQLEHGGKLSPFETGVKTICNSNRFPVVRCFQHCDDATYEITITNGASPKQVHKEGQSINLSVNGNIFTAPFTWETNTNVVRRLK